VIQSSRRRRNLNWCRPDRSQAQAVGALWARRFLSGIKRLLCIGGMRPVFFSLGLPFIQERLAFLRRTREADIVMSQLLKPRHDLSNLGRIDDVHKLSIRPSHGHFGVKFMITASWVPPSVALR
jgi:hypothetical protein